MTTHLLVDMFRGQTLRAHVVQHQVHLHRIAVETLVDFSGLDQVTDVGKAVRLLRLQWTC